MQAIWRIELLGTLKAKRDRQSLTRFRTRRVASLLAYLAYFRQSVHSREELAEILWPDADSTTARRNLRQALSSLRHVLEPAPFPSGSVVLSVHRGIQLNEQALETDVAEFESLIRRSKTANPERSLELLRAAVQLYNGDLLPGFDDEWIWSHRLRLEDLYLSALRRLGVDENPEDAIDHLRQGVVREPFNERWHTDLIRRYVDLGLFERALSQYAELARCLAESFDQTPSEESRRLADLARQALHREGRVLPPAVPRTDRSRTVQRSVSLPFYANGFFGRAQEIRLITSALERSDARLLTILGPAGVGKTRLSVHCASDLAARLDWNVWFVPLADRANAGEIYEAILGVIGGPATPSSGEISRIEHVTGGRKSLLVLDNLEQIADSAGPVIARLIEQAPSIVCLASSRQPLQIQHERMVPIDPLPVPPVDQADPVLLAEIPSVQLFLDRCQAIRPDMQLNERNAAAIADLCVRFEGLPLAIELAAGLSTGFSPVQMLHHLPTKVTGITSRRRDVPARHKSLRSAIDWSYDILSEDLRRLFRQLCVFCGGFSVAAVDEVCFSDAPLDQDRLERSLAALRALQDKSLVRSQSTEEDRPPRFFLLTAFREYAEELMPQDELQDLRTRHAGFFVRQAPPDRPYATVGEQTAWHLAIETDYDNFIAAIEFCLEIGDIERCVRLVGILSVRWLTRGPKVTERNLIRQIAAHEGLAQVGPGLQVQAKRMLGTTCIRSGEYRAAYEACAEAVVLAEAAHDRALLATCYSGLSVCAGYLGDVQECLELNLRVLEMAGSDNLVLAERSYLGLGAVYGDLGRIEEAWTAFQKARIVSEKLRGGEPDALIVFNLAQVALDMGHEAEALRLTHEAIRISRRLKDEFNMALAFTVLSRYHTMNGHLEAAVATNLQALERFEQGDFIFWILQCLRRHAVLWTKLGRYEQAATLFAATDESGARSEAAAEPDLEEAITAIRRRLSAQRFESAWSKGLTLNHVEAVRLARSHSTDG